MSNNKGNKSKNKANEPMTYAQAAALGVPYRAPPRSETPAPLYFQSGYAAPGNTPTQHAMTQLFTRRNGTAAPGPYPAGYSHSSAKVAPAPQMPMGSAAAPSVYPSAITRGPYPQGTTSNLPLGFALGALAGQGHGYASGPMGLGAVAGHAASAAAHGLASLPQVDIVGAAAAGGDCLGGAAACALQGGRKSRKRKSKRKTLRKKTLRKTLRKLR
jgi:hypothetical protein